MQSIIAWQISYFSSPRLGILMQRCIWVYCFNIRTCTRPLQWNKMYFHICTPITCFSKDNQHSSNYVTACTSLWQSWLMPLSHIQCILHNVESSFREQCILRIKWCTPLPNIKIVSYCCVNKCPMNVILVNWLHAPNTMFWAWWSLPS